MSTAAHSAGREMLAPAKINLFLLVGERRPDGYHPVFSLMEKVSLCDRLRLRRADVPGVTISGTGLPAGTNSVETAARLLGAGLSAAFELEKSIPVAAGLAGGSSDAAAALKLLVAEFDLKVDSGMLSGLARQVGADVPFFLTPGPCLAQGAGEELTSVDLPFSYEVVLVTPRVELSTASVYQLYDSMCPDEAGSFAERSRRLGAGVARIPDLETLAPLMANDLEPVAMSLCPQIATIKSELRGAGAMGALMSGSGPSVFALFAGKNAAKAAAAAQVAQGHRAWVATPVRQG